MRIDTKDQARAMDGTRRKRQGNPLRRRTSRRASAVGFKAKSDPFLKKDDPADVWVCRYADQHDGSKKHAQTTRIFAVHKLEVAAHRIPKRAPVADLISRVSSPQSRPARVSKLHSTCKHSYVFCSFLKNPNAPQSRPAATTYRKRQWPWCSPHIRVAVFTGRINGL